MKQTIGNACGTIAVLHSLANMSDRLGLSNNSPLGDFFEKTRNLDPNLKVNLLLYNEFRNKGKCSRIFR
jgi:ubiquitin carboxyl-terminal hydrolase L3